MQMQVRLVVCTDYLGGLGVFGRVSIKAFHLQRTKLVVLPTEPEQDYEILQAKLEVLDLVATERSSGGSVLAVLQCKNTFLDCAPDRWFVDMMLMLDVLPK